MIGEPFGSMMGTPLAGGKDSPQDLYRDTVADLMDALPDDLTPLQFQPENSRQDDSFLDDLFVATALTGTASAGFVLLAEEEEKRRKEAELDLESHANPIPELFVIPEFDG